jgi:hypothetical protein
MRVLGLDLRNSAGRVWGALRAAGTRATPWGKGALSWCIYLFAPVVALPVFILVVSFMGNDHPVEFSTLGGRGEFAFMGVALAVAAYTSARKVAAVKPGRMGDPHALSGLTMLVLVFCSGAWGVIQGQVAVSEPKNPTFNASVGIVLLGIAAFVSLLAAMVEARLSEPGAVVTVDLDAVNEGVVA